MFAARFLWTEMKWDVTHRLSVPLFSAAHSLGWNEIQATSHTGSVGRFHRFSAGFPREGSDFFVGWIICKGSLNWHVSVYIYILYLDHVYCVHILREWAFEVHWLHISNHTSEMLWISSRSQKVGNRFEWRKGGCFNMLEFDAERLGKYCWWKKSCTSW